MTGPGGRHARRLLPLLAAAILAAAPTASIQAAPAAPAPSVGSAPSVDEIVAGYVAARGGLEKIRSIQTLREHGRLTAGPNREAIVTRELKRPNRTRFEFTVQGVTGVFVSDGTRGWKMNPLEGDAGPSTLPDEAVQEAAEQADIEGPLVDYKAKGHLVELVGRETVGGYEAYKLKMTLKSGATRYEYLDVRTLHRVRADSTRTVRGRPVQLEVTFGDYKKTAGVLFPRRVEVAAVGRPQKLSVVVEKIEVNPKLSDSRFEMPATP